MYYYKVVKQEMYIKRSMQTLLLSLVLIFSARSQEAAQKIDLPMAISTAMKYHPLIKQMETALLQRENGKTEAFGNYLPKINLGYSFTHLNDPIAIDLNPIREAMITLQSKNQAEFANIYSILGGQAPLTDAQKLALSQKYAGQLNSLLPEFKSTLKKQDYWTATITGVQPLFTGGKIIAANNAAELEFQVAELELKRVKNEITSEVTANWLNVVFLSDLVKVRRDILAGMQKHEARAKKMLAEGLIANYNYLRAKVAVSDAERNLFDDTKKLELAMLALKNSMAIGENSEIIVADSLIFKGLQGEAEYFHLLAKQNNTILKMIDLKKKLSEEKIALERSKFMPVIAAFGKYELYPEYLSAIEPRWAVGVSLNLNLFNGMQDYTNLQNSKLLNKEIGYIEQDAQSKIRLLVSKHYTSVINSVERYEKGVSAIDLAKENLRLNEKRFETGLGTSLEVVDAEMMLEKSEIDLKTSLFEFYKNYNLLLSAAGKPEDFLKIWTNPDEVIK